MSAWVQVPPCAPPGWVPMPSPPGSTATGSAFAMETLTVTASNVLSSLTHASAGDFIELVVNGRVFLPVGSPASFSVAGTVVTWRSSIYSLNPGDDVSVVYTYLT